MKTQAQKNSVATPVKVRIMVPASGKVGAAKQVTMSPVAAKITYEGCSCWAHS